MLVVELMLAPIVLYCIAHYLKHSHKEKQAASLRPEDQVEEKPKMSIKIRPERV